MYRGKHLLTDCCNVSPAVGLDDTAVPKSMASSADRAEAIVIPQIRYHFEHNSPPCFIAMALLDERHCSAYSCTDSGLLASGIFTIGGGVQLKWTQQFFPYCDITSDRHAILHEAPRFQYGIRICQEPYHCGWLSGWTSSEGTSWGKFDSHHNGATKYAEVFADATIVLPLFIKSVFETQVGER